MLKSAIIDPLEKHINIVPWKRKCHVLHSSTSYTHKYEQVNDRSQAAAHLTIQKSGQVHHHPNKTQLIIAQSHSFQVDMGGDKALKRLESGFSENEEGL